MDKLSTIIDIETSTHTYMHTHSHKHTHIQTCTHTPCKHWPALKLEMHYRTFDKDYLYAIMCMWHRFDQQLQKIYPFCICDSVMKHCTHVVCFPFKDMLRTYTLQNIMYILWKYYLSLTIKRMLCFTNYLPVIARSNCLVWMVLDNVSFNAGFNGVKLFTYT